MKIYESKYYEFELNDSIMINRWRDNTGQMTFQDFKDALMNFAGFIIEHKSSRTLIDTTNFRFELPAEADEFRNNAFNPRITKVGEVKQALIMPKEYLQYVKDELGDDVIVPTRYFSEESEATVWLTNDQD